MPRRHGYCRICEKKLVANPNVCERRIENKSFCSGRLDACTECQITDFLCSECQEITRSDRLESDYLKAEEQSLLKRLDEVTKRQARLGKKLRSGT